MRKSVRACAVSDGGRVRGDFRAHVCACVHEISHSTDADSKAHRGESEDSHHIWP